MILKSSFVDFLDKIKLDETRSSKIQTAHNTVRDFLAEDTEIKPRFYESFLQGSYRLNTAVRPQGEGEYDVDVILSLDLNNENGDGLLNATSVIDWVAGRLKESKTYKDKVKPKRKCVRINYVDGFHMDITPAHCSGGTDGVLLVPPDWRQSHPKGFREWCVARHSASDSNFYPVVKMMKWWRNIHFGDDGSPKSILLTTIIGKHIPTKNISYDEALVKTMENINSFLQANLSVPEIKNPSLESETLSQSWSLSDYRTFRDKFKLATETAMKALAEKDEEKTIELWNSDALFKGTFPKAKRGLEEEAKKMANALRSGNLGVTSTGFVGTNLKEKTIPVLPTKFYGDERK